MHILSGMAVIAPNYFYIVQKSFDNTDNIIKNYLYIGDEVLAKGIDLSKRIEVNEDNTLVHFSVEGFKERFYVRKDPVFGWTYPQPVSELDDNNV